MSKKLPPDVIAFLRHIRGDDPTDVLRERAARMHNSPSLNESFISQAELDAAKLLEKYA